MFWEQLLYGVCHVVTDEPFALDLIDEGVKKLKEASTFTVVEIFC